MNMHKLDKIRGHIKMMEFEQTKLSKLLEEEIAQPSKRANRRGDIERALNRVTKQIDLWRDKLARFESLPPAQISRGSVLDNDPRRPLIG